MSRPRFAADLEHLFSLRAQLSSPVEVIGAVPEGIRMNFQVTGGEVSGPRLQGRLRPFGADWFTLRRDGVGELDVRILIETHDGALIHVEYLGLGDLGPEGYERFLAGDIPQRLPLRTAPRARCAHPDYQWLHRRICIGIGEADFERHEARYDVYAVR